MKIYQHESQWLIEIHGGAVLFRERDGYREAVAMGQNIPALIDHGKTMTEPGGYYVADHGTYNIANAATAEAMAALLK